LYTNESLGGFYAFGRIISGTVKVDDNVKVLGEAFTLEEEEDSIVKRINKLWVMEARYKVEVDKLGAGNWILIDGVEQTINKTATITDVEMQNMDIFKPLDFNSEAIIKVSCEPLNPSELPKMLEGLRKINKSYPLAKTKVE
jgi:U5 small nuclear ribonucleoprotein component